MSRFKVALVSLVMTCGLSVVSVTRAEFVDYDIPVPNGEFSLPEIAVGTFKSCIPQPWAREGGLVTYSGVQNIGGDGQGLVELKRGSNCWLYQTNIGATFVEGDTYTLGFDYANAQSNPYTMVAKIVYNNGLDVLKQESFSVVGSQGWTHGTVSSVAPSAASTSPIGVVFEFTTPNVAGNYLASLDSVTLTRTHFVPEPGTVAILASGLLGLLAYVWRKRK